MKPGAPAQAIEQQDLWRAVFSREFLYTPQIILAFSFRDYWPADRDRVSELNQTVHRIRGSPRLAFLWVLQSEIEIMAYSASVKCWT